MRTALISYPAGSTLAKTQVDPQLLGPAEVPGDYDRLERDYYNLRHCTCRHSDCTGDYFPAREKTARWQRGDVLPL
jgi:hypothetical protein